MKVGILETSQFFIIRYLIDNTRGEWVKKLEFPRLINVGNSGNSSDVSSYFTTASDFGPY